MATDAFGETIAAGSKVLVGGQIRAQGSSRSSVLVADTPHLVDDGELQLIGKRSEIIGTCHDFGFGLTSTAVYVNNTPVNTSWVLFRVPDRRILRHIAASFIHNSGADPGNWTVSHKVYSAAATPVLQHTDTLSVPMSNLAWGHNVATGNYTRVIDAGELIALEFAGASADQIFGHITVTYEARPA